MSTKDIRKLAILSIGAIIATFGLLPARLSAQVLTLTAGATTTVAPGNADCVTDLTINNGNDATAADAIKDLGCAGTRLFTALGTGHNLVPHKVDLTAKARFVKQFQVKAVQGAATTSFVPILIAVPVEWIGLLVNDSLVPPLGPLDSVGAHIDENMFLRLTQGDPGRATVTENRFDAASHAGVSGCLSIPTDGPAAVATGATCVLAIAQANQGTATVFLSTIVETGKTYNIELELRSDLFSFDAGVIVVGNLGGHPLGDFETNLNGTPAGVTWTAPMSITVGTDFQSNIQGLQDEITQLRADLNTLRQEFKAHTHVYLTGKGVGQNNTKVNTGPPNF